jgi:hypothetical protein
VALTLRDNDVSLGKGTAPAETGEHYHHFDWASKILYRAVDPLSTSSRGQDYCGLGCFPVGFHATQSDFDDVVRAQTRLRTLNLLKPVSNEDLASIGHNFLRFAESRQTSLAASSSPLLSPGTIPSLVIDEIESLGRALSGEFGRPLDRGVSFPSERIEVSIGLDVGFRNTDSSYQFWGVFDGDDDVIRIFVSRHAKDLAGTILHTYLASKRCERSLCFEVEDAFSGFLRGPNDESQLSPRIVQDIEMLTPTENLVFLQAITLSGNSSPFLSRIRARCEFELIESVSLQQLRKLNTLGYFGGEITADQLVANRFEWYNQSGIQKVPALDAAIDLFKRIDQIVLDILRYKRRPDAEALLSTLSKVLQPRCIDVRADLLALSVFCAFRRVAFEEVYLEATDRCPVFADQPDQLIVFGELWGTGSHTEAYLDATPKLLGQVLFRKYRQHYDAKQPPLEADDPLNLATAYPPAKSDVDRDGITNLDKGIANKLRGRAYIGVFAVPALIDILLLTTIGRGLYLSAYMTEIEQQMSTDALVIALILCGAVSSWIAAGGSYYLWAKVYPTMNLFMLTRFIGGMVFVCLTMILSFIVVLFVRGLYAAFIFTLYLTILSTYLFLLGLMSTLQFKGSPLPSVSAAFNDC